MNFGPHHSRLGWDRWILVPVALLSVLGLIVLYSASYGEGSTFFMRQLVWLAVAAVAFFWAASMDLMRWQRRAVAFYLLCLALLVVTLFWPRAGRPASRWIALGPVSLQISEFTKLALLLILAEIFSHSRVPEMGIRDFALVLMLVALPAFLVARQPDLGTALVLVACGFTLFAFLPLPRQWWLGLLAIGLLGGSFVWVNMHDYQMNRIRAFLNPEAYRFREAWHATQSTIAVGSGGWRGKGYLRGTQNQWDFISENHNDFIFTTVAEEFGLLGGVVVLGLFGMVILRGYRLAQLERRVFVAVLKLGLATLMLLQVFVNVGMVTGVLPVVGISLPYFSYGGSSLVTFAIVAGVLANRR